MFDLNERHVAAKFSNQKLIAIFQFTVIFDNKHYIDKYNLAVYQSKAIYIILYINIVTLNFCHIIVSCCYFVSMK